MSDSKFLTREENLDELILCCKLICTDIPPLTVQQLLKQLHEVNDWYSLGVVLGVPVERLQEIQASNSQGGVWHWKINMFQFWLNSTLNASWEDVISALEEIDHVALAARLKEVTVARRVMVPGNSEEVGA